MHLIYDGEVDVDADDLPKFLRTCRKLGLVGFDPSVSGKKTLFYDLNLCKFKFK
jgi:hypothetical protein